MIYNNIIQQEKLTFVTNKDGEATDSVQLLVNPELVNLQWRKVYSRLRTKSRIVTMFWGEEPVRFTLKGQTGYVYPTASEQNDAFATYNEQQKTIADRLMELYKSNSPSAIDEIRQLEKFKISLLPPANRQMQPQYNQTTLLYMSTKYSILKKLETLYREHQTPNQQDLVKFFYRDYSFKGYFENFSFTDDAKNPWNWQYSIDFIIMDWSNTTDLNTVNNERILNPKKA